MMPNKSPEPTAVGAFCSAVAVHSFWPGVAQLSTLGVMARNFYVMTLFEAI
jgi:hypothetical protein